MSEPITSRPFHPDKCCERCVFGSGEHAEWCRAGIIPFSGTIITRCHTLFETPKDLRVPNLRASL